jgi:hypothetical protein
MANFLADEILKSNRTTRKMVAGDFDFYGTGQAYLGVFKGLNMPGTLSEGSFHDYIPESWRLKNSSYLKHEAWAIARSFLLYYSKPGFSNGIVAGILRDEMERVPSSYNPISGTLDNYKAVNQAKVRLEPGSLIYNGDNFNNGYYFFDELAPGNYKLYFEAAGFKKDSANVVVAANQSVFHDKLMQIQPILDPPTIISYSPTDSLNQISNVSPITVEFSLRMNTAETQTAFSINPIVAGNFKWENDFKKLIFTPSQGYIPGVKHKVTVSTLAKTYWGVNLAQAKNFSFTTREKLNLISHYPRNGDSDISTTVLLNVKFDNGILASSLAGKISFTDSLGNTIPVNVNQGKYILGIIEFDAKTPLANNSLYRLTLREGIGDIEYVPFPKTEVIEFRTEKKYTYTGTVFEPFEDENKWRWPNANPNTVGVVGTSTTFFVVTDKKINGNTSGKLDYQFSSTSGVVELALENPVAILSSSSNEFGIWIYGDNSKNILEYRFYRESNPTAEIKVVADTLKWSGWKMKKIDLGNLPGTGALRFRSINLVQSSNGEMKGKIFFDDAISNVITDVNKELIVPSSYRLEQNYPNPFNPTTTIRYSIPSEFQNLSQHQVALKIYDLLGREISTLVNENKTPGNYEVKFNASGLSSGVYLYRIEIVNQNSGKIFIDSKKLILLK